MKLSELLFINSEYPCQTVRELMILFCLKDNGGTMRFDLIAESVGVPKPSISRAFDSLWAKRLIKRQVDVVDARRVFGVLTETGKKYLKEIVSC